MSDTRNDLVGWWTDGVRFAHVTPSGIPDTLSIQFQDRSYTACSVATFHKLGWKRGEPKPDQTRDNQK